MHNDVIIYVAKYDFVNALRLCFAIVKFDVVNTYIFQVSYVCVILKFSIFSCVLIVFSGKFLYLAGCFRILS